MRPVLGQDLAYFSGAESVLMLLQAYAPLAGGLCLLSPASPLELRVGPQGHGHWALSLSFRLGRRGPRCRAGRVSTAARALLLGWGEALELTEPAANLFSCDCRVRSPLGSCSSGVCGFPACVTQQTVYTQALQGGRT